MRFIIFLILICLIGQINGDDVLTNTNEKNISNLLTVDGNIVLNAVQKSKYQGSLDYKGFNISIDAESGQPIFRSTEISQSASEHPPSPLRE